MVPMTTVAPFVASVHEPSTSRNQPGISSDSEMHTAPASPSTTNSKTLEGGKLDSVLVSATATHSNDEQVEQLKAVTPDPPKSTTANGNNPANDNPVMAEPTEDADNEPHQHESKNNANILDQISSPPKDLVMTTATRGRSLSLDRGPNTTKSTEFTLSPFGKHEVTSSTDGATVSSGDNDDGSVADDSSDGNSSYFNKKLPSPKSGRRYLDSSNHSAPARYHSMPNNGRNHHHHHQHPHNRATSDASLSFSDESDESDVDEIIHESPGLVSLLPPQVADMQLQRITRMHSVSSLVSSDGSEDDKRNPPKSPQSTLSSSSSDPSVSAELSTVKAKSTSKQSSPYPQQSGRVSPLPANDAFKTMGRHNPHRHHYYSGPSPPNIVPTGYAAAEGMPHPQPQMMTQEQLAAWMHQQERMRGGGISSSKSSDGAFVYSDDETDDTHNFMHHLGTSHSSGGGIPGDANGYNTLRAGGGGNGGGGGANLNPRGNNNSGINSGIPSGGQYKGRGPLGDQGALAAIHGLPDEDPDDEEEDELDKKFKVYWQRWVMLFYMSILNLLSDWTCYSVAPIAILTQQTFGKVDPEQLVVIFLGANAVASACEPIILARLGLRKTVLFGSLLLMLGSMIKSGGVPPLIQAHLVKGQDEWRLYLGFFLVGLSQPLYQCTPALLSAAWFPERERTMATGVALNANQLGIGFAFIFGTLLVSASEDIPNYFGLLSILSTIAFFGTLFQFDDAPPTPPSDTAKIMRGDIHVPNMSTIINSVRNYRYKDPNTGGAPGAKDNRDKGPIRSSTPNARSKVTRRRSSPTLHPSNALWGPTSEALAARDPLLLEPEATAPSPMMPGPTQPEENQREGNESPLYDESPPSDAEGQPGYPMYPGMPYGVPPPGAQYMYNTVPPQGFPYWDPRMEQQQQQHPLFQQPPPGYFYPPPPQAYYYGGYQNAPLMYAYGPPGGFLGSYRGEFDDGLEPEVNVSPHHLDINIRDDQVIRSIKACFSRPGFVHCLVSFTVSGIVINTLSTFMDYLVTLNGAGRQYVGIVGGSFQGIIMISSLIIGNLTDKSRAYYSVIIAMLVLGAFGLAQCGVSLDADRGGDLRWSLLVVAGLIGPLQPVSTELGVDVAYPLSENTVLVIQQLFSNLISALFIPFFKSLKDVGLHGSGDNVERPEFTFSFYLLIVLHAGATVFFATFNGRYLRYEHELEKKAKKEMAQAAKQHNASGSGSAAFYPVHHGGYEDPDGYDAERTPLTNSVI